MILGPSTWVDHIEAARGHQQSPVDVNPAEAVYNPSLSNKPLSMKYDPKQAQELVNTGNGLQVAYKPDGSGEYSPEILVHARQAGASESTPTSPVRTDHDRTKNFSPRV